MPPKAPKKEVAEQIVYYLLPDDLPIKLGQVAHAPHRTSPSFSQMPSIYAQLRIQYSIFCFFQISLCPSVTVRMLMSLLICAHTEMQRLPLRNDTSWIALVVTLIITSPAAETKGMLPHKGGKRGALEALREAME